MSRSRSARAKLFRMTLLRTIAALAGFSLVASLPAGADALPRLPRAQFDVIPPSSRITGGIGHMQVYQPQCRIGPTHWARRRIVDIAVQEWAYFGFQTIDATQVQTRLLPPGILPDAQNPLRTPHLEHQALRLGTFEDDPDVADTIAGYWSAAPEGGAVIAKQDAAWNGPGGEAVNWVQPWSAAFVSWVMCEAGLGDMNQFARSISHRTYIDQAIRAHDAQAKGEAVTSAYIAYDAGDEPIAPGDLLCNSRAGTDYHDLADRRPEMGEYAPAHCDIVVSVPAGGERALVIGGNVLQSVSLTILPLARGTKPYPHPVTAEEIEGGRTVFAHLKLQADAVEPDALLHAPTIVALQARAASR
jgi:hypothetical protein